MKYDTMNEYTMTKYFESLCNSFYIAYTQVKRLEKQSEELEETGIGEELEIVEKLIDFFELSSFNGLKEKYVEQKCSQEELAKAKKKLEKQKQAYEEEMAEIDSQWKYWSTIESGIIKNVEGLLYLLEIKGFSIIITSEIEIVTLMAVSKTKSEPLRYFGNIINTKEEYLKSFPTSKLCRSFFRAYQLKDEDEMKQVIEKYF